MKKMTMIAAILIAPLSGIAQLQNMDFEDWTGTPGAYHATGWVWTNTDWVNTTATFRWGREQPAQNNDYAIKLGVWYNYTKDAALQMAPIQSRPTALKGYYNYTDNIVSDPNGNSVTDIAQVSVYLTRWNLQTAQRDTIGAGILDLNASEHYKAFTCNISYASNSQPDSIHIMLDCSLVARGASGMIANGGGVASYFTVDNLVLEENALDVQDISENNKVAVYPNPTRDMLYLDGFTGRATVYNTTGAQVLAATQLSSGGQLSLGTLPAGVYVLQTESRHGIQRQLIVRQ